MADKKYCEICEHEVGPAIPSGHPESYSYVSRSGNFWHLQCYKFQQKLDFSEETNTELRDRLTKVCVAVNSTVNRLTKVRAALTSKGDVHSVVTSRGDHVVSNVGVGEGRQAFTNFLIRRAKPNTPLHDLSLGL